MRDAVEVVGIILSTDPSLDAKIILKEFVSAAILAFYKTFSNGFFWPFKDIYKFMLSIIKIGVALNFS